MRGARLTGAVVVPGAVVVAAISMLVMTGCPTEKPISEAYAQELEQWHGERVQRLTEPTGWLSLVGLFWLEEGDNVFGTDEANKISLPPETTPAIAGTLVLDHGQVTLQVAEGVDVKVNGIAPEPNQVIHSDAEDLADVLTVGDLTMLVLERGGRLAVRVKDPDAETRSAFHGLERFPINPDLRFETELVPYDPPKQRQVPTAIGTTEQFLVPGKVQFTVDGVPCELEPVLADPASRHLFFIFGDKTNGKETYGAGRFLYSDREQDGKVVLDFNRAVNPPCAFTRFATCPLPLPHNKLPVRIEAGELRYGDH